MVFESLDHAREFTSNIHIAHEEWFNMPNYNTIAPSPRWPHLILGLCAPGFMFLMGIGIVYFDQSRKKLGWTEKRIAWHFLVRGLVLVILNFVHFPFFFFFTKFSIPLTVLFALGVNIFLGSLFLSLEKALSGALQTALVGAVQMSETAADWIGFVATCLIYVATGLGLTSGVTVYANALRIPSEMKDFSPSSLLLVAWLPCSACNSAVMSIYPFLPWLAPVLWGLLFGRIFVRYSTVTAQVAANLTASIVLLLFFVLLRAQDGFGSIHNELLDPPLMESFISFMNLTKYPPSLTYLLWTMGVNHLLLGVLLALPPMLPRNPLLVFGTSALFFYVMHFYVYFFVRMLMAPLGLTELSVWPFLVVWMAGLVVLYPLCSWYSRFKSSKGPDSIWRLF
ncbi:hypothetical protein HDV03_002217 [Kappamyces sp. JEL0829]|nr:hypothetical protein HDV03_002217 [Kappamyces sp. JEL0829]